jgi:hypothetical protein
MTPVCLEIGKKRVFASALDWPGWCRSAPVGRGEEGALEALLTYADRYAAVAQAAGLALPAAGLDLEVVERLPGDMTTDFGAPSMTAARENDAQPAGVLERHAALLTASWQVLGQVVAVTPASLRKGPRGGGRDRDAMVDHVLGAETAYARKVGVRHKQPAHDDQAAINALRADLVAALVAARTAPPGDAPAAAWPSRYAIRRLAWHVLDHAWEMQDRTG